MSYADSLGLLRTISNDKYIEAIRDGIDDLGAKMAAAGYNPADIRRYFRIVLAKLAGKRFADYCWDFFVFSRANMLFRYAEENWIGSILIASGCFGCLPYSSAVSPERRRCASTDRDENGTPASGSSSVVG